MKNYCLITLESIKPVFMILGKETHTEKASFARWSSRLARKSAVSGNIKLRLWAIVCVCLAVSKLPCEDALRIARCLAGSEIPPCG